MSKAATLKTYRLALGGILVLSLLSQLAIFWSQREYIASGLGDFVIYYTGAEILNAGKGQELYDLQVQKAHQEKFAIAHHIPGLPFNHAPYELLIFLPLAHLSYPVAYVVWCLFNVLFLAIIFRRLAPFIDSSHKIFLGSLLVSFFPTITAIKWGQDSILSGLLLVEAFGSLKRKRDAIAGGILAVGLYKPQLVLPIAGILAFKRRWRALLAFAFTGAVLVAISFAMVGRRGAVDLFSLWLSMTDRGYVVWPEIMTNIRGLLYVMLNLGSFTAATNFLAALVSLVLYLGCVHFWKGPFIVDERLFDLRCSFSIVSTVLVSYHLYSYDGFVLVIALILTFNYVLTEEAVVPTVRLAFLSVLIVIYLPLVPNFLLSYGVLAWVTLPVLILYVVIAVEIRYRTKLHPQAIQCL